MYRVRFLYVKYVSFRNATNPPGIAVPHVAGPVVVNQSRGFIIVMSDGLYEAWSAYTDQDSSKANIAIARMVAEQIRGKQQSMEVAAKIVIDSIVSSVQSTYANSQKSECRRLDDITLMIHNLGYDALECPLNGIVNFPLSTTPLPSLPPPMNTYFSQPGGGHQGHTQGMFHQGSNQYIQPIQHMPQSYDPRYMGSQFPVRAQSPNYYIPPNYGHPPGTRPENPFVFPAQTQQPVPAPPGSSHYPQPSGQEYPSTNYNISTSQQSRIVTGHRSASDISYGPTNQSSSFNSSYGSNMPIDGSNSSYSNISGTNASLISPQHHQQVGRTSTSPVPPQFNHSTAQAQPHTLQKAPVSHSSSTTQIPSSSDEDGGSTPIADPLSKEVFPIDQSGKKPIPRPRTQNLSSEDSQSSLIKAEQSFTREGTENPQPWSSSTPKKQNESQIDSYDASNLKDEDLYGSGNEGDDTFEVPLEESGERVELAKLPVENHQPPLEAEIPKSSEGNQLDQYIFDSDGEMENKLAANSDHSSDEVDDDDDDVMGTFDTSKLSIMAQGAEPTQNIVYSYVKFENFPDIEYDAL